MYMPARNKPMLAIAPQSIETGTEKPASGLSAGVVRTLEDLA
jgi:hypothetical protein